MHNSRHGKLTVGGKTLNTTLVDLPAIVESLKTLDNKQFYKIADICQMVVATEKKSAVLGRDYNWPDGLTPVLEDCRNSRFRKRMNKKIIEDVEQEVERLLVTDFEADDVTYGRNDGSY
jgi:transcription initiation factor TFIID subunit 7